MVRIQWQLLKEFRHNQCKCSRVMHLCQVSNFTYLLRLPLYTGVLFFTAVFVSFLDGFRVTS